MCYNVKEVGCSRVLGEFITTLQQTGLYDNTLIIVISDNGIDLPRGKINLYEAGTHMPMAVSWPAVTGHGGRRVVEDLVSFTDIAPTLLELAGVTPPRHMTGRSFVNLLFSQKSGIVDSTRQRVFTARERHSPYRAGYVSYPSRAVRTHEYLLIRNFEPDRWPAGDPPWFADSGGHPTYRPLIVGARDNGDDSYFTWCYAKRPAEELYVIADDPWQLSNVADDPRFAEVRDQLSRELTSYLEATGDPRVRGEDGGWDSFGWDEPLKYPIDAEADEQ